MIYSESVSVKYPSFSSCSVFDALSIALPIPNTVKKRQNIAGSEKISLKKPRIRRAYTAPLIVSDAEVIDL